MSTKTRKREKAAADLKVVRSEATAVRALERVRDKLADAVEAKDRTMQAMRESVVGVRPSGILDAQSIAKAIGRSRNYVDSIWSAYGKPDSDRKPGQPSAQTRVKPTDLSVAASTAVRDEAYRALAELGRLQKKAAANEKAVRAERNRLVALVYGSKIIGPSQIAQAVDIDRNHVGRIARAHGMAPVHRPVTRNQYSK